jgi:Bax protein
MTLMPRPALEKPVLAWSATAVSCLCVALIIGSVEIGRSAPQTVVQKSMPEAIHGARFGGRIATVIRKPVPVQYVLPPLNLQPLFDRIGYRLDHVRRYGEVPRLFLVSLPLDLQQIKQSGKRKALFIKMALPLILHANEMILWDRRRVLRLLAKARVGKTIAPGEQIWLNNKANEYGLAEPDLTELVRRIDVIPPSLALAQAAEESGWGTSRFAREGNAIFGQRTWRGKNGIKPMRRDEGKKFKVRSFGSLIDGIMSYARNLNGHFAYDKFRLARETQRRRGGELDGYSLAPTLERYSERGGAYIKTIRMLMRVNKLQAFDKARLRD